MSIKTNEIAQNETTRNTKAPFDREKYLAAEESIKLTKCKHLEQKMASRLPKVSYISTK